VEESVAQSGRSCCLERGAWIKYEALREGGLDELRRNGGRRWRRLGVQMERQVLGN
jgi:hypothetical protein